MTTATPYPPIALPAGLLDPGERHCHTFAIRGYLYAIDRPEPRTAEYRAHLTDRRVLFAPVAGGETVELLWNDVIEVEPIAGTRAAELLAGAEDHMLRLLTRVPSPLEVREAGELFLFTAEPAAGCPPTARPQHCQAFVDIAEELLLEAFEASG